jgi:hypothetical protein|tara:strand:- start:290 stop:526 length:237 start_codon:yes stop_codon:yes gene_type:complete
MDPDRINIGALVKYISIDSGPVYGLIIKQLAADTGLGTFDGPAVEIRWFDDDAVTTESLKVLKSRDIEYSYLEIINEN